MDFNPCCMCGEHVPYEFNGLRSGYCGEVCWNAWLVAHKDDVILAPYIPLQVTSIFARKEKEGK